MFFQPFVDFAFQHRLVVGGIDFAVDWPVGIPVVEMIAEGHGNVGFGFDDGRSKIFVTRDDEKAVVGLERIEGTLLVRQEVGFSSAVFKKVAQANFKSI